MHCVTRHQLSQRSVNIFSIACPTDLIKSGVAYCKTGGGGKAGLLGGVRNSGKVRVGRKSTQEAARSWQTYMSINGRFKSRSWLGSRLSYGQAFGADKGPHVSTPWLAGLRQTGNTKMEKHSFTISQTHPSPLRFVSIGSSLPCGSAAECRYHS